MREWRQRSEEGGSGSGREENVYCSMGETRRETSVIVVLVSISVRLNEHNSASQPNKKDGVHTLNTYRWNE